MSRKDCSKVKVLIIRFRQLGDSILSSTLCTSLKQSIPNSEIHYVLNEHIAPLFEGHPDIDKIIKFNNIENKRSNLYIRKVWQIMRSEKYDIIIDTRSTIKTLLFSIFSLHTPFRIGRGKFYNRIIHNYRVENLPDLAHDIVQLTLRLIEPLQKKYTVTKNEKFRIQINPIDKNNFRKKMELNGINFSRPIILCNITTKIPYKSWDTNKMEIIIRRMVDCYKNVQLIFNYGSEIEKQTATKIFNALENTDRIFLNIEAKSTKELALMLSNCDFYFGNEGGARHIAQAVNIPTCAIYSPMAKKVTWLPSPSLNNQGIEIDDFGFHKKHLINEEWSNIIDVERVWEKLNSMLQHNNFS